LICFVSYQYPVADHEQLYAFEHCLQDFEKHGAIVIYGVRGEAIFFKPMEHLTPRRKRGWILNLSLHVSDKAFDL
jgi:hypothetical protein